jgi:hypothetical protein
MPMSSTYYINDTTSYHREELKTLGWELTVANALEEISSPCRSVLDKQGSFGELLFNHLKASIPMDTLSSVAEIGGGYGFLMRDFLKKGRFSKATMIDLSPVLLDRQRDTLNNFPVTFIGNDFFSLHADQFRDHDLVLMNEIIGDFPAICDINHDFYEAADSNPDPVLVRVKNFFTTHGLPIPEGTFNLNCGAIEAVEKLCSSGVRYIYLSEHSCEARVPEEMKNKISISSADNPERIPLMGHSEFTIKFSYLERVAARLGYRVQRGQYKDFITVPYTGKVNFILTSNTQKDEHEIIRQFIEDLYKYEYLLLIRED